MGDSVKPAPRCRRNSAVVYPSRNIRGIAMNKPLVAALIAGAFLISFEARAQERAGDAALGALSGAVVLGPVGAVAGAVVCFGARASSARAPGIPRPASPSPGP